MAKGSWLCEMEPLCIILRWHTLSPKDQDDCKMMCLHNFNFGREWMFLYKGIFEYLRGAKLARPTTNDIKKYSVLNSAPRQLIM